MLPVAVVPGVLTYGWDTETHGNGWPCPEPEPGRPLAFLVGPCILGDMKELNKWSAGKKVATILLAREMAASTEETFDWLDMLHTGKRSRPSLPSAGKCCQRCLERTRCGRGQKRPWIGLRAY